MFSTTASLSNAPSLVTGGSLLAIMFISKSYAGPQIEYYRSIKPSPEYASGCIRFIAELLTYFLIKIVPMDVIFGEHD